MHEKEELYIVQTRLLQWNFSDIIKRECEIVQCGFVNLNVELIFDIAGFFELYK